MPRDIVAFAEDWGGLPSSTQHIVGRLARDRDVLWINSIGMRRPRFTRRDLSRLVTKVRHLAQPREPRAAPSVDQPTAVPVLGALGEGPVVYYVGDDFGALPGVDHEPVSAMENELVERADLILAASEALVSKFPANRTVYMPHGVDFARFSSPARRAADLPVSGPIAGFYGSIAEWVDVDLLARCAAAMPDWTFVLIGEPQPNVDVGPLRAAPNVRLLGPRPHQALPSYVQHWNVSLLPMRDTPMIRAGNPLKLREYLASGTPIAATDFGFPALAPYADLIRATADPMRFCDTIRLAADDKADSARRRARVIDESWDARVDDVSALLEAL